MIDLGTFEVDVEGKYRIPETVTVNHLLMVGLSVSGKYKRVPGACECQRHRRNESKLQGLGIFL